MRLGSTTTTTTMGVLARRFLNLIVPGRSPGIKSLRRIDLARNHLFFYGGDGSEKPPAAGGSPPALATTTAATETIRFAGPSFTFRAVDKDWRMHCFPLADYSECKLICADQSGRGFVFDLDSSMAGTIPALRKPWLMQQPVSVFVHKPHVDGNLRNHGNGSGLFVMEKFPQPEPRRGGGVQESEQFVGFISRRMCGAASKSWHCQLLPPPPFLRRTWHGYQITAYGVVGGDSSHVCISVDGGVGSGGGGTYCLDTESLTWSKAGEWTLPFCGKVEYVPALKLWFGLSSGDAGRHLALAAADLSGMRLGSSSSSSSFQPPPRLVGGPWKELVVDLPEEWKECRDPQFVSLGSGRFCIARFFSSSQQAEAAGTGGDQVVHKNFTVLTGVEVKRTGGKNGTGKLELKMTPHISRRINNTSVETLF